METPEVTPIEPTPAVAPVEVVAAPKYPTLTQEEKLAVREAQFVMTTTREQAQAAVQAAERNLLSVVEALGKKYNLNPKTTQLNPVQLTFVDAQ